MIFNASIYHLLKSLEEGSEQNQGYLGYSLKRNDLQISCFKDVMIYEIINDYDDTIIILMLGLLERKWILFLIF